MKYVTGLLLRYAARNLQGILDFIARIDAALDAYIAERESGVATAQAEIDALQSRIDTLQAERRTAENLKVGVSNLRG